MNVRILVLGILMHRPAHGYEIQQYMQLHEVERWADILPGSTYHALKKMRDEGLVEVARTEYEGKRSREVYAITEAGQVALRDLLLKAWQSAQPSVPLNWHIALPFWYCLEKSSLLGALETQLFEMDLEYRRFEQEVCSTLEPMPLPFMDLVFANVSAHHQANLTFLQNLRQRIAEMDETEAQPLELPPLEELLEKFPHLRERMRERMKGEPRNKESSQDSDQGVKMEETV